MVRPETRLIHSGRASARAVNAVNPPVVRASTTVFETLAEYKASYEGVTFETARYGRTGTATTFEFQSAMADACSTETCIATSSGLAAIAAVVGAHIKPGGKILGAVIGGAANFWATRRLARQADKFFRELPVASLERAA